MSYHVYEHAASVHMCDYDRAFGHAHVCGHMHLRGHVHGCDHAHGHGSGHVHVSGHVHACGHVHEDNTVLNGLIFIRTYFVQSHNRSCFANLQAFLKRNRVEEVYTCYLDRNFHVEGHLPCLEHDLHEGHH